MQAFLKEPTIELAHQKYLESWSLPTVQKAWKGKKPTLKAFKARFGASFKAAQNAATTTVVTIDEPTTESVQEDRKLDKIQELMEQLLRLQSDPQDPQVADEPVEDTKHVQPQNVGKIPSYKQLSFLIHRAIEEGELFACLPTTRGACADAIGHIKNGMSFKSAMVAVKKKAGK